MSGEHLVTVGAATQLPELFKGRFMKGRADLRIALVGRSNVGKSTLINGILGQRLAQTSDQPGKTRKLHLYLWNEGKRILVDLPGFGFAKASKTDREEWAGFINAYLKHDEGLEMALILLDSRHGPTELDEDAIRFIVGLGVPVRFVFTKADSLKTQSERVMRKREADAALTALGADPADAFWLSAKAKDLGFKKFISWLTSTQK